MSVAAKILKHLLGAGKGALCISDPSFFGNRVDQLLECLLGFKGSGFLRKNQLVFTNHHFGKICDIFIYL